jgi:phage portal protein BeeE
MAKLWRHLLPGGSEKRFDFNDWAQAKAFTFGNMKYPILGGGLGAFGTKAEEIENSFTGYIQGAYKRNGVVFATMLARHLLFTEARFQFQAMNKGRPGNLYGTQELDILENPWPNGTTGELLGRMDQDASLSGNFYAAREVGRIRRLRPDWVTIILTAPPEEAVESDVAGYLYRPGGLTSKNAGKIYLPKEITHWSPIPDPEKQYRGMSWLTPVLPEILADGAATEHKGRFFTNGATPSMIVSFKESVTEEQFDTFMADLREQHVGGYNAYKPMFLAGGADAQVVGANMAQMDFKKTQGAGETRIAAAGGVPAIIVGLSEGLDSATYSNFGMARRKFGDHWARPMWRSAAASLSTMVTVPPGSRLWYDDRDIAFLREDQRDQAEIQGVESRSIRTLVDAGYEPESVKAAIKAQDWDLLTHSGLYSVQLQPPGSTQAPTPAATPAKPTQGVGNGNA